MLYSLDQTYFLLHQIGVSKSGRQYNFFSRLNGHRFHTVETANPVSDTALTAICRVIHSGIRHTTCIPKEHIREFLTEVEKIGSIVKHTGQSFSVFDTEDNMRFVDAHQDPCGNWLIQYAADTQDVFSAIKNYIQ